MKVTLGDEGGDLYNLHCVYKQKEKHPDNKKKQKQKSLFQVTKKNK